MKATATTTIIPGRYRHYKGREYQVLGMAKHSESEEIFVVYRCLYCDGSLWVRPLEMFLETITISDRLIPRFALIDSSLEGESEKWGNDFPHT